MVTVKTYCLLLFLLFHLPLPSTSSTIYVTPTPPISCQGNPCFNLTYYVQNADEYLISNTIMVFLPGEHTFNEKIDIRNMNNFSMVAENASTSSVIICSGSDCGGFYFENIKKLIVIGLTFVSDSHSVTVVLIKDFLLMNCTFANNSNTALVGMYSNMLLEGNSFINNSGKGQEQEHFSPGGGISITLTSNITLQGENDFINNTCFGDQCGGSAIYGLDCHLIVEGNTNVVNNSVIDNRETDAPSGGGGFLFLRSTIEIYGRIKFYNNNVSNSFTKEDNCEISGGGASFILCNTTIIGDVTFAGNVANGKSGCGGGLYLIGGSMTITGTAKFRNNFAGYSGGGLHPVRTGVNITGSVNFSGNQALSFGGGVCFNTSNVTISGTAKFDNNHCDYYGGGSHNEGGSMTITEVGFVSFTNNSANRSGGGLAARHDGYIGITGTILSSGNYAGYDGAGIDLEDIYITTSGTLYLVGNTVGCFGGGLNTLRTTVDVTGLLSMTNNNAKNNDCANDGGGQGGGLNTDSSTLNITGTIMLMNNSAERVGGGVCLVYSQMTAIGNLSANQNSAPIAGGLMIGNSNITMGYSLVVDNKADQGGGLVADRGNVIVAEIVLFKDNLANYDGGGATLINSTFDINGTLELIHNTAVTYGGGIVLYSSNMTITGHILLKENTVDSQANGNGGGGMYLRVHSVVTVLETMTFINNSANYSGGGMTIDETSTLAIAGKVYFIGNIAGLGGAIFASDINQLVYCSSQINGAECVRDHCFFKNISNTQDKLMIFEGNRAQSGDAVFGGSLDTCILDDQPDDNSGEVFDAISDFSKQPKTHSMISSLPYRVCICKKEELLCGEIDSITAYPGETFSFKAVTVGQRNGTAIIKTINAIANPSDIARLGVFEDRQEAIGCTKVHYTLFSNIRPNFLELYVYGSCSSLEGSQNRVQIPIHLLLPCPHGFVLSNSSPYGCICEDRLQKYTNSCDINGQIILRERDYWVGFDNDSQGLILHPHCPFDYCKPKPINFTLNDVDLQCNHNRTGLLCGACKPGHSLAIGSTKCLPCSNTYLSLLVPFALMGLALVLFFLVFEVFTVKAGVISGLIFYASIVGANQKIFFPPGFKNAVGFFVLWFKLDLGIETCFYDGMDTYAKTWLLFVFPIYIFCLISGLILLKRRFPSMTKWLYFLRDNHPEAVLGTFFILSYGKIVSTVISVFSYTTLLYPNNETEKVWLYNANIKYLHGKHIPLFVVSVLFTILVILPFTLLLLFGHFLERMPKRFSLITDPLSKMMNVFYKPYVKKHRYWPGLLLLVRLALFVIFGMNALHDYSENLLAISAAVFGLIAWPWLIIGHVYDEAYKWLGVLESTYMLNLGVFACATFYVQQAGGNQAAVAYVSTAVALASFLATLIYHIYDQRAGFKKFLHCLRKCHLPKVHNTEGNRSLINVSNNDHKTYQSAVESKNEC